MTSRDTKAIINGYAWHEYAVDFVLDGVTYSFPVSALDDDHAEQVLHAIKTTGVIFGRKVGEQDA